MDSFDANKYILRDGIKIRKLIEYSISKNKSATIEECFAQLLVRSEISKDYILLLLFHFHYKGTLRIYQMSNGVLQIEQNKNTGKFFTKVPIVTTGKTWNQNYFLYLGKYEAQAQSYDVIYDFLSQSPGIISDLDLENYQEILIPKRIWEIPKSVPKFYELHLFEDLISGKLGDVKLLCTDGEIYSSKFLMSSKSEYFRNYFSFQQKIGKCSDVISLSFKVEEMKSYIHYLISGKIDSKDIHTDLIQLGNYFVHKEFLSYLYQELVIKIDSDLELQLSEKVEMYDNLLTYFLT